MYVLPEPFLDLNELIIAQAFINFQIPAHGLDELSGITAAQGIGREITEASA